MKTCVVFDTEDPKGMQATYKIVDHLAKAYLGRQLSGTDSVSYRKIAFIKMLRGYARQVEEGKLSSSLRDTKLFADEMFAAEREKRWEDTSKPF